MNIKNKTKFDIFAIIIISLLAIAITPITFQNDTFYTIKIGETIANNGIDMQDHFSWHENLNYTYPHWLYDLITYIVYSKFGFSGIYISTCILACILGIVMYIANSKLCKNNIVSFIVTGFSLFMLNMYVAARAQLVTFILFALTIYFIEKYLENKKIIYAVGLVIIPIVIANVHLAVFPFYFVLYLPYIAEYIIANMHFNMPFLNRRINKLKLKLERAQNKKLDKSRIEKIKNKLDREERILKRKVDEIKNNKGEYNRFIITKNDNVKALIIVMIICLFTGFLTPLGTTPYTYLIKTMLGDTTGYILEHTPMVVASFPEGLAYMMILILFLIFSKSKLKVSDFCFLLGLTLLSLFSRRQFSMLVLLASFIFPKLIMQVLSNNKNIVIKESINKYVALIIIVIVVDICGSILKYKASDNFVDQEEYPVEATEYILNNIDIKNAKFYNEYQHGSYLIYKEIPVFIDSRADLYDPKFSGREDNIFMDYMNVLSMKVYYGEIFEKYGITHILINKDSPLNIVISGNKDSRYNQIYSDKNFVIYEIMK